MLLLLSPALRLILSSTDLRSLYSTVLDQRSSADLDCLVESNFIIINEATLSEAVVLLDNIIILRLLDHLHLVDASLAV